MNFNGKDISIIDEGKGWVAVYKPSGVSIHNEKEDLLHHAEKLIEEKKLGPSINYDKAFGLNPVHRLDRETSGVVILACTKESFRFISSQFENHSVEKRYSALVHGFIEKTDWKIWDKPLSKEAGGRKNIPGNGKKVPCKTSYLVKDNSEHYTLLEIDLGTGRKHQIRKHAALSGHPLVYDERYGSKRALGFLKEKYPDIRLCLHCFLISFKAPTGELKRIEISGLPPLFAELLDGDR